MWFSKFVKFSSVCFFWFVLSTNVNFSMEKILFFDSLRVFRTFESSSQHLSNQTQLKSWIVFSREFDSRRFISNSVHCYQPEYIAALEFAQIVLSNDCANFLFIYLFQMPYTQICIGMENARNILNEWNRTQCWIFAEIAFYWLACWLAFEQWIA